MNKKILISIIAVLILAAGIGAYFIFQKPISQPQIGRCGDGICGVREKANPELCPQDCQQTGKCSQIMPPSPILEEQCEGEGGKLVPKKNEKGCIIGYECKKKETTCTENWQCSNWSSCQGGTQTRTCSDKNNCGTTQNKPAESQNCEEVIEKISSVSLLKKVDIENGARPEIIATDNRIFVVYLDTSTPQSSKFSVKVFDEDMNTEVAYKTLVSKSEYGSPTDIRVAPDGNYVYAFYEAADLTAKKSYLFGAKYNLNDGFERVAYTDLVATSKSYGSHLSGDEHLDDPIVLIGQSSVFVMTRILSSSVYTYVVREFDKDLNFKKSFNIELSSIAESKGDYGQASAVYYNGYYYMVIPSMKGVASLDLFLVKFNTNWNIVDYRFISQSSKDEYFVTGIQAYGDYLFVAYKEGKIGDASSILKIFDDDFNEIISTTVKKVEVKGESLRPSLSVNNGKVFVGLPTGGGPPPMGSGSQTFGTGTGGTRKASIYIFEMK